MCRTGVTRLASQCPQTDGNVVFASQNLYNAITNEHRRFSSPCDLNSSLVTKQANKLVSKKVGQSEINDVVIYPNPANTFVFVSGKHLQDIELINNTGSRISKKMANSSNTEISLQNLSKGVYFIKVTDNKGKVVVKKIIKAS